jgi:serine/threonine protein kinase
MTYGAPPGSTEPTYMMALEWCDGDLEGVVLDRKKHPEFTMKTALELATGVACGMAYIHRKDVLHLDIKMVRDPCWQRFCCDCSTDQTLTLSLCLIAALAGERVA